MKYFFLLILFALSLSASAKALEKVSLQLVWLDQFQFAGYYMAKERGFYKEAGFDVDIKKFQYSMDTVDEVLSGRATFGVGRSSLIRMRSQGKEVVLLSAIFQSSPLMLLALESSNIKSVKDFIGKTMMLTKNAVETASIHAMITSNGVDEDSIRFKEHNFDFEEFLDGGVDLYAGYTSNEPYILEQRNIPYKMFSPKEAGFDFYSDLLFTSQKEVHNNPKKVDRFRRASLKGWKYAFDNIGETVKIIHERYNPQNKTIAALTYEANELKRLAYSANVKLGDISEEKVLRIFDVYKIMGLTQSKLDTHEFIFNGCSNLLSSKELSYLRAKKEIKICVPPASLPYSGIKDGEFVGIGADVLALAAKHIGADFKLIQTATWSESMQKAINKECDLLPIVEKTPSRTKHFNFTDPYYEEPLVVVTDNSKNYILDIETVLDKEFSAVKGHSYIEILEKKYPTIKLHIVNTRKEAYLGIQSGKYYGHIDMKMAAAYYIQRYNKVDLKICGQLKESVKIGFGVRNDDKTLFDIFEKIALNVELEDMQEVLNEWVSIHYTNGGNFKNIKRIFIAIFVIATIFLYRQYLLNKKNTELQKLQEELRELNRSLEYKVADAVSEVVKKDAYLLHQSRLAQMGEMLSMIAHQWKQPLNSISTTQISIRMALELEKYDLNDNQQREDFIEFLHQKLDKIGAYTQNLSQIISDFSDFYRPNAKSEIMLMSRVITKACNIIEDSMDANNIELQLDLHSNTVVKIHENEFMQVILNILNNAKEQLVNKSVEHAHIMVKNYDEDGYSILEISDNAGGIDEAALPNIFDPYFSTKLEKNGTGLGLYMSKNIIQDYHNGSIIAKNNKEGALFVIKIHSEDVDE